MIEEYNSTSKKPMNLVFFDFALEHLLKIQRILKMSRAHAILLGLKISFFEN